MNIKIKDEMLKAVKSSSIKGIGSLLNVAVSWLSPHI